MENIEVNSKSKVAMKQPNNNMVFACISTILGIYSFLFIGFFIGIVAVFMARLSTSRFKSGDYQDAIVKAKSSRVLCYIILVLVGIAVIFTGYVINQEGGIDVFIEQMKQASQQPSK